MSRTLEKLSIPLTIRQLELNQIQFQRLEPVLKDTLAKFKKLKTEVVFGDGEKWLLFPLCPTLKLLGIALPEIPDGADYDVAMYNFCEYLGIPDEDIMFDPDEPDGTLPSQHIPNLICRIGWHPEIAEQFVSRLERFVAKKIASAPQKLPLY